MSEDPLAPPGMAPTTPGPVRRYDDGTTTVTRATSDWHPRPRAEVKRFFAGMKIVPPCEGAGPAVTHLGLWGAEDPELAGSDGVHGWFGAVARSVTDRPSSPPAAGRPSPAGKQAMPRTSTRGMLVTGQYDKRW
jgi:hypothetical protein